MGLSFEIPLPRVIFAVDSSQASRVLPIQLGNTYFRRHCSYFMASEWVLKGTDWYLGRRAWVLERFLLYRASQLVSHLFPHAKPLWLALFSLWCGRLFLYHPHPLLFDSLMAPRRETTASRAQGKCSVEPSQPSEAEACRKARFDTNLFTSMEEYQRYKQKFT